MNSHLTFIKKMVAKGGPKPADYESFTNWLNIIAYELQHGKLGKQEIQSLQKVFGEALSEKTLQGMAFTKPKGYAGDYEMIDKIYQKNVSDNISLKNWDRYFHEQSAPTAVRNRKDYFKQLLRNKITLTDQKEPLTVLNIASGPARDVFEFLSNEWTGEVLFDCLDHDINAIRYAENLCAEFLDQIQFIHANAFKFKTEKRYDLVWSAGLFDYFDDKTFVYLLTCLRTFLSEDGELVIGNFSTNNPSRNYMEIVGDWYLHHRNTEDLMSLAKRSGIHHNNIHIGSEPEGVNLFLHVKNGGFKYSQN